MAGLGGGVVMVPILAILMGLEQHKAHGTSLSAIFVASIVASLTYGHFGHVPLTLSLVLALFSSTSAFVGAKFTRKISASTLRKWFGWFLLVVSLSMFLGGVSGSFRGIVGSGVAYWVFVAFTGILSGLVGGILGVGGGTVRIPLLVLFLGVPQWSAQGASLFSMIPTSFVGAITHWKMGNVEVRLAPWLWVSISVGALLGGILAHYLPATTLRKTFAVIVGLVALREILFLSSKLNG